MKITILASSTNYNHMLPNHKQETMLSNNIITRAMCQENFAGIIPYKGMYKIFYIRGLLFVVTTQSAFLPSSSLR